MKILLFGKSGQVGWELQRSLAPLGEIVAPDRSGDALPLCGNLEALDELAHTVRSARPEVIVNAAAYTAVDKAESQPELAWTVNAAAPGVLAREAANLGAWLVHYSSDYVFDGSGSSEWREDDPTGPLNVYGRTKLEGEILIRESGCHHLILRTSWVYASRGRNFARTILRLAMEREYLDVIDDQIGAPTGADLLADVTAHALLAAVRRPGLAGVYHCAAGGEASWHDFACRAIEFAREAGQPVKASQGNIRRVSSAAFAAPAIRPHNSRLSTHKLRDAFGVSLPDWRQGVDRMLTEILEQ